jgi:tRNA dimethylallyltransferase
MAKSSPPIIFLVGPTSVGKTTLAIKLAQWLDTEIISADSRQIYRYLDIGTAKPSQEQLEIVPHHIISIVSPEKEFTVADYLKACRNIIEEFNQRQKIPLIVGGTGLYVKALTRGLFEGHAADKRLRYELKERIKEKGLPDLFLKLQEVDPQAGKKIHPHDERRITRALEVYYQTGIPISVFQQERTFPPFHCPIITLGLKRERSDLYQRIENRIDCMLEEGLIEEVKNLLDQNYSENLNALNALGYRDIICYLKGGQSLEVAINNFIRDTKRLAKRQMTWFKKEEQICWYDVTGSINGDDKEKEILEKIKSDIQSWLGQL